MFFKHYQSSDSFYIFVITKEMFIQVSELEAMMMIEESCLNNVTSCYYRLPYYRDVINTLCNIMDKTLGVAPEFKFPYAS